MKTHFHRGFKGAIAIARYGIVIVAGIPSPTLGKGGIVVVLYIECTPCKDPNTKGGSKMSLYFIPSLIDLVPGHPYKWVPASASSPGSRSDHIKLSLL